MFASQDDGNWRALRSIVSVMKTGAAKLRGAREGAQRPALQVSELKKTGARSARARTRGQNPLLSYIYLRSSVCHIPVCHPVILSSCHSCGTLSYSLCLSNQTAKETKGRVSRGRDTDGEIGNGDIEEGGCE